jgi:hypothetical protein
VIDQFDRSNETLRVSRLVSLSRAELDAILVGRSIALEDFDEVKAAVIGVGTIVSARDAIKQTFARTEILPQRYNTSSFVALYTAVARETCVAEITYHLGSEIQQSGPRYFQFLEVTFTGNILNLVGRQNDHPDLVSATSSGYPFCQQIATDARDAGFDALSAPSARHDVGVCVPIFTQESITNPLVSGNVRFNYNGTTIDHAIF